MKQHKLTVTKRAVLGKKVKKLRKEGILPGNIYGKGVESLAVQMPLKEFQAVYEEAGETGVVTIQVDGESRPTLIHNLQIDHITHAPLHADFYQVNLKEKVKTMVPVVTVGDPLAVTEKVGLMLQPITEIEVEALPNDLPEHIEINVEKLAQVGDQITVADLPKPTGVAILTEPEQVVVKIDELISEDAKELAEEMAAEAAAVDEAKTEEGEGEAKDSEEKPEDDKGDKKEEQGESAKDNKKEDKKE